MENTSSGTFQAIHFPSLLFFFFFRTNALTNSLEFIRVERQSSAIIVERPQWHVV